MNTEKSLYLVLNNLYRAIADHEVVDHLPGNTMGVLQKAHNEAKHVMDQFELELGPLPDWATAHNIAGEPVLYAQLYTRNGRAQGNGMIFHIAGSTFGVITDMGNTMALSRPELDQLFEIGDFIMDEAAYEKRKRQRDDYIEPLEHD